MAEDIWLEIGLDKNQQRIDALQCDIGVRHVERTGWVNVISRDATRHFAMGIGDNNFRWHGREGAGAPKSIGAIAPPSILYAASPTINATLCPIADGWAWNGASWQWHAPLTLNLELIVTTWVEAIESKEDIRTGGRIYTIRNRSEFHDTSGALIAEVETLERSCAIGGLKEKRSTPDRLTPYHLDDVVDIYSVYAAEAPQSGAIFFDDVSVGDKLPTIAKGPITPSATIAFLQGIGGMAAANRLAWQAAQHRPYDAPENTFGVPDTQARVHWDEAFARARGLPGSSPPASARSCWLIHQITDWMGDHSMLRAADCVINAPDPEGESLFIYGEIADRFVEDGRHLVQILQRAERRDLTVSVTGSALVELPVRI